MGFESLSSAIAHVIINYHAYRTKTPLPDISDASIKDFLNRSTDERDQILKDKIIEATTRNNSCRLTLLQYMHLGLSLSEKARITENPDEQEALKSQLVEFIQNLQRLFVFTPANLFITDTLLIALNAEQSLSIYKLNSPKAEAYKLTQTLFSTIGLSSSNSESTEVEIQHYISDLFLFKKNQALSQENIAIEASIDSITQYMNNLEHQIHQIHQTTITTAALKSIQPKQEVLVPTDKAVTTPEIHELHPAKGWEFITNESSVASEIESEIELENTRLIAQNEKLKTIYEEKKQCFILLESTLTTLQKKPEPAPIALTTSELCLGLSRRKITSEAVVTEQPMHRDTGEAKVKNTVRSFRGAIDSGRLSLFGLLAKSLDPTHGFSDSASSDSSNSDSVDSRSSLS
ncbi:MAG: hypothetical protein P1U36_03130 [Legionellaceae bacterium]|nr:hypothetical protein [Legionellaceae bacterium]